MERSSLHQSIINKSDEGLDKRRLFQLVILLKKSSRLTQSKRTIYMKEAFILTSGITIKAINNFYSLMVKYNVPKIQIIHDENDIISECYVFFDRCITNCKMEDFKKFHFYLNSAYNRAMFRLYEKYYKKHAGILRPNLNQDDYDQLMNYLLQNSEGHNTCVDFGDIELHKAGLTQIEEELMDMKVNGGNFHKFLKKFNIPHAVYTKNLENLQEKIMELYGYK